MKSRSISNQIQVSLPIDLNSDILMIAEKQKKTVSEVFRKALKQYVAQSLVSEIRKQTKKLRNKMTPEDIENIIDEDRK